MHSKVEYPADFLFVAAMNPCPCGNLLHPTLECRCNELEIKRYKNRLSEPFLDRIDLTVEMQPIKSDDVPTLSSKEMHAMVIAAFRAQKERGQTRLNGALSENEIERYCILQNDAKALLQQASERFALSFRSIAKIKRVARTIADLERSESIERAHLLEALGFRRRQAIL